MEIRLKKKPKTFKGIRGFRIPPEARAWGIHAPGVKKPIGFVAYASRYPDLFIYVAPPYRGRGIAIKAENMLAQQEGRKGWIAFIDRENKSSIRAHEKGGFQMIAKGETVPDGWKYLELFKKYDHLGNKGG